jgi:mannose-1-phosphate guanylyltransferase|tara:strand:- start:401 stop:778 length:378 start_codon:yes stop_codon:yes gene_type:complete
MPLFESQHVQKPWGSVTTIAKNKHYSARILRINQGHRISKHYHIVKDETIYIMRGRLMIEIVEDGHESVRILKRGDVFRIKPKTIHRFCAHCNCDVKLLEISGAKVDDEIRLEDDYDREVMIAKT